MTKNPGKIHVLLEHLPILGVRIDGDSVIVQWDGIPTPSQESAAQAIIDAYDPTMPESVTPLQARLALIQSNISLAQVEAAIDAIADVPRRETARAYWEYAPVFSAEHPLIATLGAALGLTDAQIDALFRLAATL